MRTAPSSCWVVAALALAACGTRTNLSQLPPAPRTDAGPDSGVFDDAGRDGGSDGGSDAGRDGGSDAGASLAVDCGRSRRYTAPRLPIGVSATVTSGEPYVGGWSLVGRPDGSRPDVTQGPAPDTVTLTPDVEGTFELVFTATDVSGRTAACEVTVESVVGPPVALCPEETLRTFAGEPLPVVGDGFDDEMVVAYRWEVTQQPPRSAAVLLDDREPTVVFIGEELGEYVLTLTVTDRDGATGSCETLIQVTGPPTVECPPPVRVPTRQPVTVEARATDDVGIASTRWELLSRPRTSEAVLAPVDRLATTMTPDRQGEYRLRFTATDVEGLSASCETSVFGLPTPPVVTCPEVVETTPLTPVEITASAVDDGSIVSWSWRLTERAPGSTAGEPRPANRPTTVFEPDIAGIYVLTVVATDDDGMTGTCMTRVEAGNIDGLRVEMFWDTDGTDMDLHLLNPDGTSWQSRDDCYYANCITRPNGTPQLSWYGPGPEDDPRLDIDDVNGFGPENINVERPFPGVYRIGVHNFSGGPVNRVTVRVYCGGSTTEPREVFGPVALRPRRDTNDFWRVADVEITAAGCQIIDLADASGPNIEAYGTARSRR